MPRAALSAALLSKKPLGTAASGCPAAPAAGIAAGPWGPAACKLEAGRFVPASCCCCAGCFSTPLPAGCGRRQGQGSTTQTVSTSRRLSSHASSRRVSRTWLVCRGSQCCVQRTFAASKKSDGSAAAPPLLVAAAAGCNPRGAAAAGCCLAAGGAAAAACSTNRARGRGKVSALWQQGEDSSLRSAPSWLSKLSAAPWTAQVANGGQRLAQSSVHVLLLFGAAAVGAPAWLRGLSALGLP